jgi:geranylgeranyl diphosphate synthase type I
MEAKAYLKDYIEKTTPILDSFFKAEEKKAAQISPITAEMMRIYRRFMGGKNIRGSLTKLGYECFGGKNEKAILKASLMVEITHAWILMHDDIMDKDVLRRGMPTIHVQYRKLHQKRYKKGEADHYGNCMALDIGDTGFALSHLILANCDFSNQIKIKVLRRFDEQLLMTAHGQALDVTYELMDKLGEEEVMRVHQYKTAHYTITGPLQYGALFTDADEKEIGKIEKYGLPVGIAFQLRDDELGLFSDEKTLGKPIGSDVKENKNTILHLKALEWAKGKDKEFVKKSYGNRDLTKKELERVRRITQKTGALDYSQKMGRRLVEKGKKFVPQITSDPELQDTLYKMADFMIEREK